LFLQTLSRLISIRRKRRDVNQSGYTSVRPGGSDNGPAIGMTDQNHWRADSTESPLYVGDITNMRVQTVLGCDHLETFFLKCRDNMGKAWAGPPKSVNEDDAGFTRSSHGIAPLFQCEM